MIFSPRRALLRNVCEMSVPCLDLVTVLHRSVPPRWGLHQGWVEIQEVDGAIEVTMMDDFFSE